MPVIPVARLRSALFLAPPAVAAIWFGWPAFDIMIAAAALILAYEWWRLCGEGAAATLAVLATGVFAATGAAAAGWMPYAFAAIATAAAVLLVLGPRRVWMAAGALCLGLPCALLVWLRADPEAGLETVLWLFIIVWASDIGAVLAGRALGGPRLAPQISPNKTWAGVGGGILGAGVAGCLAALAFGGEHPVRALAIGALFSLIAQLGDLAESWMKRRFGVKDSGTLIPGHGGLLDRVDALLLAATAMGLLTAMREGSIVSWM